MKTFDLIFMKISKLISAFPILMIIFAGCSEEKWGPADLIGNSGEMAVRSSFVHEGTIVLEGITGFGFFAAKEQRVLADPYENTCECKAELTFNDKQTFVLHTKEYLGGQMYRAVSFNGTITPDGQVKFSYPMTFTEFDFVSNDYVVKTVGILPEMKLHTGCAFYGSGIIENTLNYSGYFIGNKFFADMHIVGLQEVSGQMPFLAKIVEGPIMINFLIDLELPPGSPKTITGNNNINYSY